MANSSALVEICAKRQHSSTNVTNMTEYFKVCFSALQLLPAVAASKSTFFPKILTKNSSQRILDSTQRSGWREERLQLDLCVIEGDGIGHEVDSGGSARAANGRPGCRGPKSRSGLGLLSSSTEIRCLTIRCVWRWNAALSCLARRRRLRTRSKAITCRLCVCAANCARLPACARRAICLCQPRAQGVNLLVVRETTEDLYIGHEHTEDEGRTGISEKVITRTATENVARKTYELARARWAQQSDDRPQSQRHDAVGRLVPARGAGSRRAVPADHHRRTAGRYRSLLDGQRPDALRRDPDAQPLRRHPFRHGGGLGRRAGACAVAEHRRRRRAGRAGAWLRAGHRREGHRQPDGDDPERSRCCCAITGSATTLRCASRTPCVQRSTKARTPPTSTPKTRSRPTKFTDKVCKHLE